MKLTEKEKLLLKDLKTEERLCIDKYNKGVEAANCKNLKNLFSSIVEKEQGHLNTLEKIEKGIEVEPKKASPKKQQPNLKSTVTGAKAQSDAYLCQDALTSEKQISSVYNTSVFEFAQPKLRNVLSQIQGEEQGHGLLLYNYMAQNKMY